MSQRSALCADTTEAPVDGFAMAALSILSTDLRKTISASDVLEPLINELYRAVSDMDPAKAPAVIDRLLDVGISAEQIADFYIPSVARRLGDAWCKDTMDFAKVSIGSARLQGLLRYLGPNWCSGECPPRANAPTCLLLVPEDAQHTLGATILAGQMRRLGFSVTLEIGTSLKDLTYILSQDPVDAVMVSASSRESLEMIRAIVENVRKFLGDVPVVIGGNVLSLDVDVAGLTGADLATSDLSEAIEFCALSLSPFQVVEAR